MKILKITFFAVMLGLTIPVVSACNDNDGAFEEMGEDADEAIEEVEDEIDDATDAR